MFAAPFSLVFYLKELTIIRLLIAETFRVHLPETGNANRVAPQKVSAVRSAAFPSAADKDD